MQSPNAAMVLFVVAFISSFVGCRANFQHCIGTRLIAGIMITVRYADE